MVASGCFCPSGCEAERQACEAGGACTRAASLAQVYVMEKTPVLDVVYEDADVLLVNKRPGISVTEDAGGGATLTAYSGPVYA